MIFVLLQNAYGISFSVFNAIGQLGSRARFPHSRPASHFDTWIIDIADLYNVSFRCVSVRAARENPLLAPPTVPNSIEFSRVNSDQTARRGKAGTHVSVCRAKASHNRPSPRGILLPVPRNKNFTHTVYFGESVWIPATGNTSHIPYQIGVLQAVTYLRSSRTVRCNQRFR